MNNLNAMMDASCQEQPSWLEAEVLVLGCGNTLMGDDGFGPAVVEHLTAQYPIAPGVRVEDVGTSVRDLLFDLVLAGARPRRIILVDAAHHSGRPAGEIFELPVGQMDLEKVNDFSVHHFPSLNLLKELAEMPGVEVRLVVAQVRDIPAEVRPGLSPEVAAAVGRAGAWIWRLLEQEAEGGEPVAVNGRETGGSICS